MSQEAGHDPVVRAGTRHRACQEALRRAENGDEALRLGVVMIQRHHHRVMHMLLELELELRQQMLRVWETEDG